MAIPEGLNLTIYKGDTFSFAFRLRSRTAYGSPGDYVSLDGATVKAQIRANEDATQVIAEFTCVIAEPQTDPANTGRVTLSLTPDITGATNFNDGMWDVQVTWPDNTVTTYLRGSVKVIKEVTRA
jgi:nitrogen fixation protein FixH